MLRGVVAEVFAAVFFEAGWRGDGGLSAMPRLQRAARDSDGGKKQLVVLFQRGRRMD